MMSLREASKASTINPFASASLSGASMDRPIADRMAETEHSEVQDLITEEKQRIMDGRISADLKTYYHMPNISYPDYTESDVEDLSNNLSLLSAKSVLPSANARMSHPASTSRWPYPQYTPYVPPPSAHQLYAPEGEDARLTGRTEALPYRVGDGHTEFERPISAARTSQQENDTTKPSGLDWLIPVPSNPPSYIALSSDQQLRDIERERMRSKQLETRTMQHADPKAYKGMVGNDNVSLARENPNDKILEKKLEMYKQKIRDLENGGIASQNLKYELNTRSPPSALPTPEKSLFEKYNENMRHEQLKPKRSLITKAFIGEENALKSPEAYTQPFCEFLTENPTVFHAVDYFEKKLEKAGFKKLSERKTWNEELVAGGKYFVSRNGSSLIAFSVGDVYKSGNGVAMIAGHVDALTAKLKPISTKKTSAGYLQLGVAPYAGALNTTWWDRDLGIAGKVLVKDESTGKIMPKLVKLGWPSKFFHSPLYEFPNIISCPYSNACPTLRCWYAWTKQRRNTSRPHYWAR